jgi:hypothetical protein
MQGQLINAGTGHLGQSVRDRTTRTGQLKRTVRMAIVAGHNDRKEMAGLPKHYRTGQLGQDNNLDNTAMTGQLGHGSRNRRAGTG